MNLEHSPQKKSRKKNESAPVSEPSIITKERKPRKPLTDEQKARALERRRANAEAKKRALESLEEKFNPTPSIPDTEHQDIEQDSGLVPEKFQEVPFEPPVDLDDLSFEDIVGKQESLESQEQTNDEALLGQRLDEMVRKGLATVETIPHDIDFPTDPFDTKPEAIEKLPENVIIASHISPSQALQPTEPFRAPLNSKQESQKTFQHYPETKLNPFKSRKEQPSLWNRLKNYFIDEDQL